MQVASDVYFATFANHPFFWMVSKESRYQIFNLVNKQFFCHIRNSNLIVRVYGFFLPLFSHGWGSGLGMSIARPLPQRIAVAKVLVGQG